MLGTGASSAFAIEAGLLLLEKEAAPVTLSGSGGETTLAVGGTRISCTATKDTAELGTAGATHASKGTATMTLTGCKEIKGESKLACRSENAKGEKDPTETILVNGEVSAVNVLKEATLESGTAFVIAPADGTFVARVRCGVGTVEVRGTAFGLTLVSSLTADVISATLDYLAAGEVCDSGDKVCEALKAEKPLEANFAGSFEKATIEGTCGETASKMALVDD